MKKLFPISIVLLSSCSIGKTDPTFDVRTSVNRHSFDDTKGIRIEVYPIEKDGK